MIETTNYIEPEYVDPEGICEECKRWKVLYFDGVSWLCEICQDDEQR